MEKIKIYLDTNTVIDFFINQAKAIKLKEKLKLPEKMKFFIINLDKFDFMTSFLTKTEIVRELVAGLSIDESTVERVWKKIIITLKIKYIESFTFDEEIVDIVRKFKIKLRTIVNFMHLFIARNEDAVFVTGDKEIVRIVRENKLYDKILTYIELRKLIS